MAARSLRAFASGRVQGVSFRAYTQDAARRAGAVGWVRNLADGRVEMRIEGDADAVSSTLEAVRRGPPHGRVDDLSVEDCVPEGFDRFAIVD